MKTTYLKEYENYAKKKIAIIPVGTLEWHGNHLPIETDFMVAQKISEIISQKKSAYVLPPIYLGSGTKQRIGGKLFIGMSRHLRKNLSGELYFIEPKFLSDILLNLSKNLLKQGFSKIYIVSGHWSKGQAKGLLLTEKKLKNVTIVNPYDILEKNGLSIRHADEYETSLFWACYPEEEAKSRKIKIGNDDDYFKFIGYDPRKKASLKIGKKMLNDIVSRIGKKIK